ncbi:MAG: phosphatidylserine decarboxylase family protein [Thermodesulfobacteriota bacterium]|nr:phosphatidylserine decarboxylase family protein [Desulfovibrionales bacterium]MDQ7837425.1 phosphatidylserine decarboxylase family protein [Thermodesulfobacteriota bacterium]
MAKEGYPFIFIAAFTALLAALLNWVIVSVFFWAAGIFILYFFRDPERVVPDDPRAVVSPADGKVILIEKVTDERFLHGQVLKISIFMNIFNVHVNRIPYDGVVEEIRYQAGQFLAADQARASFENENNAVFLEVEDDRRMVVVQVAGVLARRIVCWAENGDKVRKGMRFGMIRFGSRLDIYLPLSTQIEVEIDQRVVAGQTVLGYLT